MNLFMIVMYSYLAAMGIAVWFYYRTLYLCAIKK